MYDVIIVGARCAGSPTAMLLARRGYRVLLLDKVIFPKDSVRSHFIRLPAMVRLKRWGILERVVASNSPLIPRTVIDYNSFSLDGVSVPLEGMTECCGPRRFALDKILVDVAVEAGAELREGCTVDELLYDNGRVVGIRAHRNHVQATQFFTEHARLVIGADGLYSFVARAVQAPIYHAFPSYSCAYYTYWSGIALQANVVYQRERFTFFAFPTNNQQILVGFQTPLHRLPEIRADIAGYYKKMLDTYVPVFAEQIHTARQEGRFIGVSDLPNFYRKPYGAGWALVGDAGCHKDPILALGISDAFRDVELIVEAIDAGYSGRRPLEDALSDYEQQRNQESWPLYKLTLQAAQIEPPSLEKLRLMRALSEDPEELSCYLGIANGVIPVSRFFAPTNIERILKKHGV